MLNELTQEQIELQAKKRDEWINIALHEKKHNLLIRSWPDPQKPTLTYYQIVKLNLNGQPINTPQQSTLSVSN